MKKRALFVCNTPYQILVSMWIKHILLNDVTSDIIISDHMNNGNKLCENMERYGNFEKCYFVKTRDFCYSDKYSIDYRDKRKKPVILFNPTKYLSQFVVLNERYSELFIANVDQFAQLLYFAESRKNPKLRLNLYEDGIATYTSVFEECYNSTRMPDMDLIHFLAYKYIFRKKYIYGNIDTVLVFNPEIFAWKIDSEINKISHIDRNDRDFVEKCNQVFDYYKLKDDYDRKYIFMEESMFADGFKVNDIEIVDRIATIVGKENIMVKIHPRNPVNRFKESGYKTNNNTSIPWEVILLNGCNFEEQNLIAIVSTSILNPLLVFNMRMTCYVIYNLINEDVKKSSPALNGEIWRFSKRIFDQYPDLFVVIDDIDCFKAQS